MIIIGITGTLGSGKGTIVEYLTQYKGFNHYSVREYLKSELNKQGISSNRDSFVELANSLRQKNGPSFIIDELYQQAEDGNKNSIIESIRTNGEIDSLKNKPIPFYLFTVDADPRIRYKRIRQRDSETDRISFDTFISNEKREMNSNDPNHQSLDKCIGVADYSFTNNGSREELFRKVEEVLIQIIGSNGNSRIHEIEKTENVLKSIGDPGKE
ncbi:MAG: AAA family ATPase [Bacteroidales bacterium]|jgi:dephospho-CoA kinase|nr:AAA family ATPase [Bacteroidales bacterium]